MKGEKECIESEQKVTVTGEAAQREEHNAGSLADAEPDAHRNQLLPKLDSSGNGSAGGTAPPQNHSDRIAALQNAVANGTYQVSAEDIAEAVLSEQEIRDESAA